MGYVICLESKNMIELTSQSYKYIIKKVNVSTITEIEFADSRNRENEI